MWCKNFWCQKVLPLVYDNSLSYYEVLCKLAKRIDDIGDAIDTTGFMKTTGDVGNGRYYFNAPLANPNAGTIIVNEADETEPAVVRVQNSGLGYGVELRVSDTGNRGVVDASAIINEDGTSTPANGVYKWLIYKDTENRIRVPDSIHGYNVGNLFQAWGSGDTYVSLVPDAMTPVPLTGENAIRTAVESDFYEIVNGGVKVTQGGIYKVCGAVYMSGSLDGGATSKDAYIRKGTTTFDDATEISGASDNIYTGDQMGSPSNVNIAPKIVYANANDIFFLGCRIRHGGGTFNPTVNGTYLLIERVM